MLMINTNPPYGARVPVPVRNPIAFPVSTPNIAPRGPTAPAPVAGASAPPPAPPALPVKLQRPVSISVPPSLAPSGGGMVQSQPSGAPPSGAPPSITLGPSTPLFPSLPQTVTVAGFSITQGWLVLAGIVAVVAFVVSRQK